MNPLTKSLVAFVIFIHLMFFMLEALFWMNPVVYSILLKFLDNPVAIDYATQALTLKALFVNQGFYNFFLSILGLVGAVLLKKNERQQSGYLLILALCFCGAGAGIVLACSTKAYLLAFFQAVPAGIAFWRVYPLYSASISSR
ncbi:DUF1304 family protein [Rhodanobacter sp. L36]|uniref:DUF1304 family protein n=1 Tax=Rhodanobacter sp. L36 TaxID=1747221 RepID=UPI00131BD8D6|nr:DUF1304 family protein [Rhodanobacter sp. L36]